MLGRGIALSTILGLVFPLLLTACSKRGRNPLGLSTTVTLSPTNGGNGNNSGNNNGNNSGNNSGNNGGSNSGGNGNSSGGNGSGNSSGGNGSGNSSGGNGSGNSSGGNGSGSGSGNFQDRLVITTGAGDFTQYAYDYGSRVPGTTTDRTFRIKNLRAVASSGQVFSALAPGFQMVSNNCVAAIAAGAICEFVVRFLPVSAQAFSSAITISYTGASGAESLSLHLLGTGIPRANIVADEEVVDFGAKVINSPYTMTLTFRNVGRLNGYVGFVDLSSPFSVVSPPEMIPVNGSASLTIQFNPTAIGNYDQLLRVAYADIEGELTSFRVRVKGRGVTRALVTTSPLELDFGLREVGGNYTLPVTVSNSGSLSASITYTGHTPPLSLVNPPATVANGTPATLTFQYSPTSAGTIDQTVVLNVSDELGPRGGFGVRIRGRAAVRATLASVPGSINYGIRYLNRVIDRQITVTNSGGLTARATYSGLSAPYSLVSAAPQEILASQSITYTLRFAPTSPGDASQKFRITYTDDLGTSRVLEVGLNGRGLQARIVHGAGQSGGPHVMGRDATNPGYVTDSYFAYNPAFTGGVAVASCDLDLDGIPEHITGAGPGGGPHVVVYRGNVGKNWDNVASMMGSFFAYDPAFTGGVSVACGDINGDGRPDIITGARTGGGPHVIVYDGSRTDWNYDRGYTMLRSFFAYDPAFTGGVWVASGDVNGDGRQDIITGAGAGGGPHVIAYNGYSADANYDRGWTMLTSFMAYHPSLTTGIKVAAGDVNGDGREEIVVGTGRGAAPHVIAYDAALGPNWDNAASMRLSFYAYDPAFTGGVSVATTDANNDGKFDIVTGAGPSGGPHVIVYNSAAGPSYNNGASMLSSFFGYDPAFGGGIFVSADRF